MNNFTIRRNNFLNRDVEAYYHTEYYKMGEPRNPDYVNHLKNQFGKNSQEILQKSYNELYNVLGDDFYKLKTMLPDDCIVCTVPRAKAEKEYTQNQLLFKKAVSCVARQVFIDGTHYIKRVCNTATTHLKNYDGYNQPNERMPYRGITNDTCVISGEVRGKTILLVDDIYTKSVNIDEDCIQALYDKGAERVVFYAIGKTTHIAIDNNTLCHPENKQSSENTNARIELSQRVAQKRAEQEALILQQILQHRFKRLRNEDFDPNNEKHIAFLEFLKKN